jgi:hypothetical protein
MSGQIRATLSVVLAATLTLTLGSCSDDKDGDKDVGVDAPAGVEASKCLQPPDITMCHRPPNIYSKILWFCDGCGYCGGGPATKACNGMNGDCREFYDSCIPETYSRCDKNATDAILGLCGDCFFREAGTIPSHCNKLVDAGLSDTK